jgi:hypothetical protein
VAIHLYHADLGPGNIIIGPDNGIAAVIDWESAAFYPLFWICTKPSVSPGLNFDPSIPGVEDGEWRKLKGRLEECGFPGFADRYMRWSGLMS